MQRLLFRVEFKDAMGAVFRLDTTDPAKVGPWIAEMFGLMPWHPSWGPQSPVMITTSSLEVA